MPAMIMEHAIDPRDEILKKLGDLSQIEIFNNQILVAVYVRPNKTKSGIYLSDKTTDEDRYQGKVGLLLKAGPAAFEDDGKWFSGMTFTPGQDWLVFRPSEGWSITVNGVLCRIFDDIDVRGRIPQPDVVW